MVADIGFNMVWAHDPPYTGQAWEDSHMYKCLQIPGIDYVFAKIERARWDWTHEQSLAHARWVAGLSLEHTGIIGVYLNDFMLEMTEGHRTEEQWREIISVFREINPNLDLWVPHYPGEERHDFDFDLDGVIFNLWDSGTQISQAEQHLATARKYHPDKKMIAGLYLSSGRENRWLTEEEFKTILELFVDNVNSGEIDGLRIFSAGQLNQRPEYIPWAKEVLSGLGR